MKIFRLFVLFLLVSFVFYVFSSTSIAQNNKMWENNSNDKKTNPQSNNGGIQDTPDITNPGNQPFVPETQNLSDESEFESTKEDDGIDYN